MDKYFNVTEYLPNFKANKKFSSIAEHLLELSHVEWLQLKDIVDDLFETKVAEIKLDDSDQLKERLEIEFSGLSKAQRNVLLSGLNNMQKL